jgi:hypothetical protein
MGAQRALEKLEPLIQWFKNKTGFHLQKPESHHKRKSESEPCHRKTQATSMKPWPREMKIHSSGEHPTKQAEKINLLSEQLCRVLEHGGIMSRERKSLLPTDDTRNRKIECATVFSWAVEDRISTVQNPGVGAHVATKKNQTADLKSKLDSGRPAHAEGKHEESRAVASGQGSVREQGTCTNTKN